MQYQLLCLHLYKHMDHLGHHSQDAVLDSLSKCKNDTGIKFWIFISPADAARPKLGVLVNWPFVRSAPTQTMPRKHNTFECKAFYLIGVHFISHPYPPLLSHFLHSTTVLYVIYRMHGSFSLKFLQPLLTWRQATEYLVSPSPCSWHSTSHTLLTFHGNISWFCLVPESKMWNQPFAVIFEWMQLLFKKKTHSHIPEAAGDRQ